MSKPLPEPPPMDQFSSLGGELQLAGQSITAVREKMGGTPFYAYDSTVIRARVAELRRVFPDQLSLHYAMKANPMPEVVKLLATLTDGLDVASGLELAVALTSDTNPADMSFAGPGKSTVELEAAVRAGVILNMESVGEMRRIAAIGDATGVQPRVAVRVNPAFELKTSGMKMGGGPKPFGVDEEQVPDMLRELGALGLDFRGFHIYSGSQNLRVDAIIEAQNKTLALATELAEHAPATPRWLNIGGGLGVPYFPGERALDLAPIADNLELLLQRAKQQLPEAEIVMELGRYLVAEAGVYVCEVVDVKQSRGETFAVTNGGLHHHLAASGNFGQVIRKNYPVAVANKMDEVERQPLNVVGPLCTPLDILADKYPLPPVEPGDLIAVYQSGAYGFTASPRDFLSHPQPGQILL